MAVIAAVKGDLKDLLRDELEDQNGEINSR